MSANVYATRSDVYKYGLPRGTLGMPARLVDSALAATDAITLDGHGFATNDEVIFRAADGGALAAPLVAGTVYFAIYLTDSTFQIAASLDGSAINLTSDVGTDAMFVATPLPFDDVLEYYSRFVDGFIPHAAPLESPYPVVVRGIVAELAAKKLQAICGHESVSVGGAEQAARVQLERWSKGVPIRDATSPQASSNLAAVSSVVASGRDPRGWGSRCLP